MKKLWQNNKGSLNDMVYICVVLLFFSGMILVGYAITSKINDKFQDSAVLTADGKSASSKITGYFTTIIDSSFLFFAVGLAIVTLVLASMVRIHPMFIPLYFIGLVFVIFVSGIASNIYQNMANASGLSAYASQLTMITTLMNILPLFVGIFGTVLMFIMYKLYANAQE